MRPRASEAGLPPDERRGLYPAPIRYRLDGAGLPVVDRDRYPQNLLDVRCSEISGRLRRRRLLAGAACLLSAFALSAAAIWLGLSV